MAEFYPNSGENYVNRVLRDKWNSGVFQYAFLFVNDVPYGDTITWGNFVQASYPGYAAIPLQSWGNPVTDENGRSRLVHAPIVFAATIYDAPQTVIGWGRVSEVFDLIAYERFPVPIEVQFGFGTVPLLPVMACQNLNV